jgi:SPP1 gp7 family putative phage head morphogenesis protein
MMRSFTFDAAKKTIHGKFKPSSRAEMEFARQLKKVAKASAGIVNSHVDGVDIRDTDEMMKILRDYAKRLEPWARRQAEKLVSEVERSNKRAYAMKSKELGGLLKQEIYNSRVGLEALAKITEQVELIKSIPIELGLRAQGIAFRAATEGRRAEPDKDIIDSLINEMGMTEEVATNRARLIARTETARATAAINQDRAVQAGSIQYRWRNAGDAAVRDSHKYLHGKPLNGQVFYWSDPPTLDDGMTGHPGTFPNCRCYAEPVFLDE